MTELTRAAVPLWRQYVRAARRPVHTLALLAPLIVLVELARRLAEPVHPQFRSQVARQFLETLLSVTGAAGAWLPPLALLATLVWLTARSGQWRVRLWVCTGMMLESALAAVPLLMLARVIGPLTAGGLVTRLCEGVGAGLYEEFVFRQLLIPALIFVGAAWWPRRASGRDALRAAAARPGDRPAARSKPAPDAIRFAAVLVSGLAFSWVHFHPLGGEAFDSLAFLSRCLAGCYLGFLFLQRGLGIAAGAHAIYNAIMIWT